MRTTFNCVFFDIRTAVWNRELLPVIFYVTTRIEFQIQELLRSDKRRNYQQDIKLIMLPNLKTGASRYWSKLNDFVFVFEMRTMARFNLVLFELKRTFNLTYCALHNERKLGVFRLMV